MANPEHLQILKRGVQVWNQWRNQHRDIRPDLRAAHLFGINLAGSLLILTNLRAADLAEAHPQRGYPHSK